MHSRPKLAEKLGITPYSKQGEQNILFQISTNVRRTQVFVAKADATMPMVDTLATATEDTASMQKPRSAKVSNREGSAGTLSLGYNGNELLRKEFLCL